MPALHDQAVVLRCWDFSETSQTVAVLCRGAGMLRGLAKGARRRTGSFGGSLEPLTRGEIGFIARGGPELATLVDWDLHEVFWGARRDLRAHYASVYVADATYHAVLDQDPHPGLFDALVAALRGFERVEDVPARLVRFQWDLLVEIGYRPRLIAPAPQEAARDLAPSLRRVTEYFHPLAGGVVDGSAGPPGGRGAGPWRVRRETLDAVRTLEAGEPLPRGNVETLGRAARLLGAYLSAVLDREIQSGETLFGLNGVAGGKSR